MNTTSNPTAVRSQNELMEALVLLMKEMPYAEITVKRILLESKLSRKTFYRNFDDKIDLLNSYLDRLIMQYSRELELNNDYRFTNMLNVISHFIIQNKDQLKLFWDNNLEYMILKKLNESILKHHNMISKSSSRTEDYIVMFNNGAIWNVINEWMRSGMTDSFDEILLAMEKYLINIGNIDLSHLCHHDEIKPESVKSTHVREISTVP